MAKAPVIAPKAEVTSIAPKKEVRLAWPENQKQLSPTPRLFRIHRMEDGFAWQAYVTQDGQEFPIGKPDCIDVLKARIFGVMRQEGQVEFMAAKLKKTQNAG